MTAVLFLSTWKVLIVYDCPLTFNQLTTLNCLRRPLDEQLKLFEEERNWIWFSGSVLKLLWQLINSNGNITQLWYLAINGNFLLFSQNFLCQFALSQIEAHQCHYNIKNNKNLQKYSGAISNTASIIFLVLRPIFFSLTEFLVVFESVFWFQAPVTQLNSGWRFSCSSILAPPQILTTLFCDSINMFPDIFQSAHRECEFHVETELVVAMFWNSLSFV